MPEADPLRIVEQVYQWPATDQAWLAGIAEGAMPYSVGGGVIICSLRCAANVQVEHMIGAADANPEHCAAIQSYCEHLPATFGAALFAPTEFVGNAAFRLNRLSKETGSGVEGLSPGASLPPMWAVVAGNPYERAVLVAFPATDALTSSSEPFPNKDRRTLGLVAAHLGAALRLRALASPATEALRTEAVLSTDGTVLHAEGEAREPRVRESLAEAVLRSERARGALRRVDSAEAIRMWTALVEGRWSILETTERDGKRFLIARRNRLNAPDVLQLTPEENDVVWLAAQGHSYKYIAYELGISVSAVTRRLGRSFKKLRIASRRELLLRLGSTR